MIYLFITLLVFFYSKRKYTKLAGTSNQYPFNFISYIFFVDLVISSLIGALFIVLRIDDSNTLSRSLNITQQERFLCWVIVIYTILSMPIGMKIAQYVFKTGKIDDAYSSFVNSDLISEKSYNGLPYRILIISVYSLSLLATLYTYQRMKEIPLLLILAGENVLKIAESRIDVSRNFIGIARIKDINTILAPMLSYISYSIYRKDKRIKSAFLSFILFLNGFLMVSYNGAKSSLAFYFLGYIFVLLYLWKKEDKKTIIIILLIIFMSILSGYIFIAQKTDIKALLSLDQGIVGRVFIAQIEGLAAHLNIFPKIESYTGISSFLGESLSNIFGIQRSDFSYRTTALIAWGNKNTFSRIGVMNTLFIAEAYAAFGFLGVLFSPIYVGFFLQSIFLYLIKINKTPFSVGVLAFFSCRTNVTGSFNAFLYNPYISFVIFIIICILYISRFFSISIKGKV